MFVPVSVRAVSAIQPSVLARTNVIATGLAGAWQLEHDVLVRAPEPGDEAVCCLSGGGVQATLNAAAWTYVAGALAAIAQLLYFLSLLNNR